MALGDIHLHFAWQAWHSATATFLLCGRRGTYGTGLALWRAWSLLGRHWSRGDAVAVCVVGVALGDIHLHFAWQAWHLATFTCTLRGKRGTWRHRPSFGVAGVALGDIQAASESISLKYHFVTRNFVTHNLSHLSLSLSLSHTTLSHTTLTPNSFTHNTFSQISLTHHTFTYIHIQLLQTTSPPPSPLFFLPFPSHFLA